MKRRFRLSSRKRISDSILTASVGLGLFYSPALAGLLLALLARGDLAQLNWRRHHTLHLLAVVYAIGVLIIRGTADSGGALLYFAFLWALPFLMTIYKPDEHTLAVFSRLLVGLFVADFAFNLHLLVVGQDLLGRPIDIRPGVISGRYGGIFAHSFYSGLISIATLITLLWRHHSSTWWLLLPVVNLLLAGSWRLTVAIPLILLFAYRWSYRSRKIELLLIVALSFLIVGGVVATSGLATSNFEGNSSNTFRVFAWLVSIEKIATSPFLGVGFPNELGLADQGVSFESMDENLIGESWYLNSAMTFGVPYVVLSLMALLSAFYSNEAYYQRDLRRAVLFPFVIIDLTYGNFFGSTLIYSWLWLLIAAPVQSPLPKCAPRERKNSRTGPRRLELGSSVLLQSQSELRLSGGMRCESAPITNAPRIGITR